MIPFRAISRGPPRQPKHSRSTCRRHATPVIFPLSAMGNTIAYDSESIPRIITSFLGFFYISPHKPLFSDSHHHYAPGTLQYAALRASPAIVPADGPRITGKHDGQRPRLVPQGSRYRTGWQSISKHTGSGEQTITYTRGAYCTRRICHSRPLTASQCTRVY